MRDRADILERVLEITRRLAEPLELNDLLGTIVQAALSILDADRGSVFLYDAAADVLVSRVATGSGELRVPANRGFAGECVRTRAVVVVNDAYADPRFNPDVDRATGYRTRCILTIPLVGHDDALVGVLQVLNKRDGTFGEDDVAVATALAAQCAVAIQRMKLLEDLLAKQRLERELEVAKDIQTRVLPRVMPELAAYEVAGWSRAADQTGGDIFDVIETGGRVILLLGDATGHGIGPALSVTQVRAMLRIAVRLGAGLDDAFRHINDQLSDDLSSNRFVTGFLGILDTERHELSYHSGGQGPLLHFHAARGEATLETATTLPMGMMPIMRLKPPRVAPIEAGDVFAAITDGIFEYENAADEMFGEDRVVDLFRAHRGSTARELLDLVVREVDAFAAGAPQKDDMTLVVLRRKP
ncbi:MAG TPA: GAF domain-containing SpoIIE family protein phosphatase [Candidatus Polarisedimenticolaceae bacterium]|nr:GAF domain-containing SpoIIE family protein phosphatase [Candidatus Polarisedimenticolaceae bacterium]